MNEKENQMGHSRVLKFRAWDKKEKLMRYEHKYDSWILAVEFNGNLIEFEPYGGAIETLDWAIMQYTGLKDKNGKEIYEGDIFDCHYKNESKNHHKWQVVWSDELARFVLKRIGNPCNQTMVEHRVRDYSGWGGEVIGNIYENPELIK